MILALVIAILIAVFILANLEWILPLVGWLLKIGFGLAAVILVLATMA